jgi:hypothetical protein
MTHENTYRDDTINDNEYVDFLMIDYTQKILLFEFLKFKSIKNILKW